MKLTRLAFAAPVLAFGTTADAVRNPDYLDERPVEAAAGPPARRDRTASWRPPASAEAAWKAFLADHGRWQALWDGETGVPSRVYGEGIPAPGALADPAIAETAARRVLEAQLALFAPGAAAGDFVVLTNQLHADGARRTRPTAGCSTGSPPARRWRPRTPAIPPRPTTAPACSAPISARTAATATTSPATR